MRKIEQSIIVRSIRGGLITIIPVLLIGAFALILKELPIEAYRNALASFANGFFVSLLDMINVATFKILSVYMTIFISREFMKNTADENVVSGGAVLASLISFFILVGSNLESFSVSSMGPNSMFLAIITGLGASYLYVIFSRLLNKKKITVYTSGANKDFNRTLTTIAPILIVVSIVAVFDLIVEIVFHVESFRELISEFFNLLFSVGEVGFFKGFFFVLLSSVLWMFGIHGSDTLEDVMTKYFVPGLETNMSAVAAGGAPTAILTKEFFDCFVLMGGCGSTICLLIALLLFSRNKARRGLAVASAFPMVFNINEMMVFGLPIIFNPIMLIPFLTVPLACYSVAYLALSTGLVPLIQSEVVWTTPVFLSGIQATASWKAAVLQGFNLTMGVLIYMPFVRILDRRTEEESKSIFSSFVEFFKEFEATHPFDRITDRNDGNAEIAKGLSAELKEMVSKQDFAMAYQPQYHYDGTCIGVEALLRWKHPVHGFIYPPLLIKLAQEGGYLETLEESIVQRVLQDRPKVYEKFGENVKISFNITGITVISDSFLQFLHHIDANNPFQGKNLCLEVTEQAYLAFDNRTHKAFEAIRGMGILLAIDDFSMGQTSLNYLKDNMFDIIKLDGSLVKGLKTHSNCREIISSIASLSSSLDLTVFAEFVETEEDREILHEIGCDCYQGYLYSPAVLLD